MVNLESAKPTILMVFCLSIISGPLIPQGLCLKQEVAQANYYLLEDRSMAKHCKGQLPFLQELADGGIL